MTDFTKVIPPGSEGKITASVNLAHAKGPIEKYVTVKTNDPDRSEFKLTLKAAVKSYVDMQPMDSIRFTVDKGQNQTQEITLTPSYKDPIHLTSAVADANWVSVSLTPSGPDDNKEKEYKLKASITDSAKVGTENATIKITAEGSPEPEIVIPVSAVIRGAISINPPMLTFLIKSFPEEVGARAAVNVRQTGDPNGAVLFKLPAESSMRVINQNPEWYQIVTLGDASTPNVNKVGWVSKSVVKATKMSVPPTEQSIVLQKSSGPFKVLNYLGIPELKVQMDPGADGKTYTFRVSVNDLPKTPRTIPGNIQVKTDDPDQSSVNIPVYIIIS